MAGHTLHVVQISFPVTVRHDVPEPPYVQVARQVRAAIDSGQVGGRLPSIMDFTESTGLAVGTIRRAIGVLVDEGRVVTVPGVGMFVTDQEPPG